MRARVPTVFALRCAAAREPTGKARGGVLRIAVASSHQIIVGGVEIWLRALVPELVRRGHEVGLVFEFSARPGAAVADGSSPLRTFCREELGTDGVVAALARWRPDVVFAHGFAASEIERALLDRFPVVLYAHTYQGTCAVGAKWHQFPQYRPCVRRMGPACLALNYLLRCGGLSPVTLLRNYERQRLLASFLPRYKAIVVASGHMREEFLRHGLPASKIHVAPLAPPALEPDPEPPAARSITGRIAFLGRLTRVKGAHVLLEAMGCAGAALDRRLHLDVLGEGPERPRLEELARRLRLDVDFGGWVEGQARIERLRASDLLAVPSLWPEPFGLVGVEAGCAGVPAVGFAQGGLLQWLRPGTSGELAPSPPATAAGLADAIVRALRDPAHHARLRLGAWNTAREFTMRAHLAALEPILARACADG